MKNKFSVQDILDFNPCSNYTEERITELFKSVGCEKYITIDKLFKVNIPHQDFFWLILRNDFISEKELHMIAIWCFERIAQPIWEKYYPDDKRPGRKSLKLSLFPNRISTTKIYVGVDAIHTVTCNLPEWNSSWFEP